MLMHFARVACSLVAVLLVTGQATAQNYPTKPVALVVPLAPGGPADGEARYYTDKLQASLGQPFVFDFRPGAGTTIGTAYVARAVPDGHTLLLHNGGFTIHPNFYPDLPYDVIRSFDPVTLVSDRATILMVSPVALPDIHTIADLAAYGRANPGKLNCGTAGQGGITHIVCAALSSAINVPITAVHYKGASQNQIDIIAGRIHLASGTLFKALPQIKTGKLRPIAVTSAKRSPALPKVPTIAESGVPGFETVQWIAMSVPRGTPKWAVDRLNAEIAAGVKSAELRERLSAQGYDPESSTPQQLADTIKVEYARFGKLIKSIGLKDD